MNTSTNTTKLTAPDIVCGGCANAIKNALGNVEGVRSVEVDVGEKTVTVEHEIGRAPREKVVATIEGAGFPVS